MDFSEYQEQWAEEFSDETAAMLADFVLPEDAARLIVSLDMAEGVH